MKCPECDLEQPENTAICAGCGLNFAMWRAHTGEPLPSSHAPAEEPTENVEKTNLPEAEAKPSLEGITPTEDAGNPAEKPKAFKWSPLYSLGIGLLIAVVLGVFLFSRRSHNPQPNPENTVPAPTALTTPGEATPANSIMATGTPGQAVDSPTPESTSTPTEIPKPKEPTASPVPTVDSSAGAADTSSAGDPTETPSPIPSVTTALPTAATPAKTPGPGDLLESSGGLTLSLPTAIPTP
jgi:hypothetical protein